MNGVYEYVVSVIFVVMILDGLDGWVVCMINIQSEFGEQYDSFFDCILFGVVLVLVCYFWFLFMLGKFGWMIVFVYVVCVVLCLVCFNVQIDMVDKCYFIGLFSLVVVGVVVGIVWFGINQ